MPARPIARRRLSVTLNPLPLIGCIALGLWFGFVAIVLTCWLIYRAAGPASLAPVAALLHPTTLTSTPPPASSNVMFEQYQQNLYQHEQQQRLEQARDSNRNQANPTCQFWLQQDQNAPTDKSRANVLRFCN